MSENKANSMILRCPICLVRENDVPLFNDEKGYYCVRCSFTGTESEVNTLYLGIRTKFKNLQKRFTLEEQRKM